MPGCSAPTATPRRSSRISSTLASTQTSPKLSARVRNRLALGKAFNPDIFNPAPIQGLPDIEIPTPDSDYEKDGTSSFSGSDDEMAENVRRKACKPRRGRPKMLEKQVQKPQRGLPKMLGKLVKKPQRGLPKLLEKQVQKPQRGLPKTLEKRAKKPQRSRPQMLEKGAKKPRAPAAKRAVQKQIQNERRDRVAAAIKAGRTFEALPGRTEEFDWIKRTVSGLLTSRLGGCLYISGVPGTGKTATTHGTLDWLAAEALQGRMPEFDFVEINGMRLSDPSQAYSMLAKAVLEGKQGANGSAALKKLEAHYRSVAREARKKGPGARKGEAGRPCIVLLDELDLLLQRKQSLLYHFFEWPNWPNSQLIVVTIANTMDLPERFLSNRISSRLGLTRYNFKPYDHAALAAIIEHQLRDWAHLLGKDAVQLCARKVSAVSGDARRAVNLAKRAIDYFRSCPKGELMARITGCADGSTTQATAPSAVNLRLMDLVMRDALMANPVQVIHSASILQKLLLLAVCLVKRRLEDEQALKGEARIIGDAGACASRPCTLARVLEAHLQLCRTHQVSPLPTLLQQYSLLDALDSMTLLRVTRLRDNGPAAIVALLVHEDDVKKGLADEDQSLRKYFS